MTFGEEYPLLTHPFEAILIDALRITSLSLSHLYIAHFTLSSALLVHATETLCYECTQLRSRRINQYKLCQ